MVPAKQQGKTDEYFLSFEERENAKKKKTEYLLLQAELEHSLVSSLRVAKPDLSLDEQTWAGVGPALRAALETVLWRRGEAFANATKTGDIQVIDGAEILSLLAASDVAGAVAGHMSPEDIAATVIEVLERPSSQVRLYLHRLADAYTMFAFLRQAPDIQKVVVSIFSNGDLWLDTTMVLPLLAETLLDDPTERHYTVLIRAMRDAGLRLFVTEGVLEETEAHLNLSLNCARTISSDWKSRVPFVLSAYFLSGRARSAFVDWLERFMGNARPMEDLREYLSVTHGIELRSLADSARTASTELRSAVQEIFLEAHERRRKVFGDEEELDQTTLFKLVGHDVENVVGIMQLRKQAAANPLGYRAWWLTLDKTANNLRAALKERIGGGAPASPAMSPDFMAQYLRLGPLRTAIDRELWVGLPIVTDVTRIGSLPIELIAQADGIRNRHLGLEENVLRRRVRDELDDIKMRRGPESLKGIGGMRERLGGSIEDQRRRLQGGAR